MNIRLYASEEMISELEDMKWKLFKMKQTKKNTGKEMSKASVSSKTMSDNVIYMWLTFMKEKRGDRRNI